MADSTAKRRPVRQLNADTARKIAAGEVIDRPASIIRELMDNAVDSGANEITVEISGGGIESIRVSDNGSGFTKEDLLASARPHATSKISDADDLLKLSTLGFRGEALSSIAAVSRLSISSGNWKMRCSLTEDHILQEIPPVQSGVGTIVQSEGLFENFPARRQFLKRPSSESMVCREVFVEKALPRADISFRLFIDGSLRLDLPSGTSKAQRFVSAMGLKESASLFYEVKKSADSSIDGENPDWSFSLLTGEPSIYRNDRKNILIYVNGRKVTEYSLVQAIDYGAQGFFPNGVHPVAALFVNVNPALVDFNIHPAKKEVRFKDLSGLHHGVSSAAREFYRSYTVKKMQEPSEDDFSSISREFSFSQDFDGKSLDSNLSVAEKTYAPPTRTSDFSSYNPRTSSYRERFFSYEKSPYHDSLSSVSPQQREVTNLAISAILGDEGQDAPPSQPQSQPFEHVQVNSVDQADSDGFRFIGSVLGTFLVAQVKNTVYFIDQHAAHERILFDKILASAGEKQNLLIPYTIHTESREEDDYLQSILLPLASAGFTGENKGNGDWEFTTVPVRWRGTEEDFLKAILEKRDEPEKILYSVAAMTACKAAVKDGFILDRESAAKLAKDALALPDPHCPHGRPVWTKLSREELFLRVRRT